MAIKIPQVSFSIPPSFQSAVKRANEQVEWMARAAMYSGVQWGTPDIGHLLGSRAASADEEEYWHGSDGQGFTESPEPLEYWHAGGAVGTVTVFKGASGYTHLTQESAIEMFGGGSFMSFAAGAHRPMRTKDVRILIKDEIDDYQGEP
jgi:hypothetical protein